MPCPPELIPGPLASLRSTDSSAGKAPVCDLPHSADLSAPAVPIYCQRVMSDISAFGIEPSVDSDRRLDALGPTLVRANLGIRADGQAVLLDHDLAAHPGRGKQPGALGSRRQAASARRRISMAVRLTATIGTIRLRNPAKT